MNKGIREIPADDSVGKIESTVSPSTSDIAYPVGTMWINTASSQIYIHCGLGAWTQIGRTGSGGEWGSGELVTISGGAITVEAGKWYKVDTEAGAASDNLDTINGLSAGEEVMLSAYNASRSVVLRTGIDNISIRVNTTLNDLLDRVRLISDGTNLVEASSRP